MRQQFFSSFVATDSALLFNLLTPSDSEALKRQSEAHPLQNRLHIGLENYVSHWGNIFFFLRHCRKRKNISPINFIPHELLFPSHLLPFGKIVLMHAFVSVIRNIFPVFFFFFTRVLRIFQYKADKYISVYVSWSQKTCISVFYSEILFRVSLSSPDPKHCTRCGPRRRYEGIKIDINVL